LRDRRQDQYDRVCLPGVGDPHFGTLNPKDRSRISGGSPRAGGAVADGMADRDRFRHRRFNPHSGRCAASSDGSQQTACRPRCVSAVIYARFGRSNGTHGRRMCAPT
jgi:hypothetical protein